MSDVTHQRVYDKLVATARERRLITYAELGQVADLDLSTRLDQLGQILDKIAVADVRAGRPLLVAVVVRADHGAPSKGFFNFAKKNGLMKKQDEIGFFATELQRVYATWSSATP